MQKSASIHSRTSRLKSANLLCRPTTDREPCAGAQALSADPPVAARQRVRDHGAVHLAGAHLFDLIWAENKESSRCTNIKLLPNIKYFRNIDMFTSSLSLVSCVGNQLRRATCGAASVKPAIRARAAGEVSQPENVICVNRARHRRNTTCQSS